MQIRLPSKFQDILQADHHFNGVVQTTIGQFGDWFATSKTPFFLDYTDHGPAHISDVLETAAEIINPECYPTITAGDITVLTLATILHDSALHLAEPGFEALIRGPAKARLIPAFDNQTWTALWDEFLFKSARWDDKKQALIFGEAFVKQGLHVRDPLANWGNSTDADRKLIGEFIRLHHARLAHEFAIFGVPNGTTPGIALPQEIPTEIRDLAGIVARSHGHPVRRFIDHLAKTYHKQEFQGVHTVFLIVLLRIADFLQIELTRANKIVFKYRRILSPTSHLEWKTHNAVKNVTPQHEDPESFDIRAEPEDVQTYLRLRQWLDALQSELDASWAVLGEVYGRYDGLKELGLRLRRIRSNMDNPEFYHSRTFVPKHIRIEAARTELLSLLIRPLYGDHPSFGIRELIQNAIDAVKERETIALIHPEVSKLNFCAQGADVVVWLDDYDPKRESALFEISDSGIGMTEDVVVNFFLTAGASYRHSDEWKRAFEENGVPNDPTKPKSKVARSGRFGVGVLAAFLLGDEIEVETRHFTSTTGLSFKVGLHTDPVQIKRSTDLPFGTRIRVWMSRIRFRELSHSITKSAGGNWDWYLAASPKLLRLRGSNKEKIIVDSIHFSRWTTVATSLPIKVQWKFASPNTVEAPRLTCNGIFISDSPALPRSHLINTDLYF